MEYDAFISHASEDKDAIARPLARHLMARGYRVWFDETALTVGDSLRATIDNGLARCRFGIVIISPSFLSKGWTQYELNGLTAREMGEQSKVILPIWHEISRDVVASYSPTLADKVALVSTLSLETLADRLSETLGAPAHRVVVPLEPIASPTSAKSFVIGADEVCPRCGQQGEIFGFEGGDGDEAAWFECPHCGLFQGIY